MSDFRAEAIKYLRQTAEGEPEIVLDRILNDEAAPTTSARIAQSKPVDPDRVERLAKLSAQASVCTLCELSRTRNKVVFGVGDPSADLMFVGEAPGADEDAKGEPFVGRAGQLLTKIIEAMQLSRSEVYIANILKCRPPGNRNPMAHEAELCMPYLQQQIDIVRPKLIVGLGLVAATHLLGLQPNAALKDVRGRIHDLGGRPLIITYHPAALLRNPAFKGPTWQDMQSAMKILSGQTVWTPKSTGIN